MMAGGYYDPEGDLSAYGWDPAAQAAAPPAPLAPARPTLGGRIRSGLGRIRQGIARSGIDLNQAFLVGRGEEGLALQREAMMEERRRLDDLQTRRKRAAEELAQRGVDPFTEEGARDAFAVLYEHGLTDEIDALSKAIEAQRRGQTEGPAEYEVVVNGTPRKMVRQADGSYRDVGEAVAKQPLVTIGGSGLDPNQAVTAEDRARAETAARTQAHRDKVDRFRQLQALYARIKAEKRTANPAETDTIVKLAARIENPEAVNESDVYRKAGGSLWNVARSWGGLPPELDDQQLDAIYGVAEAISSDAEQQLAQIEEEARGVAEGRGLNPRAVAPGSRAPAPARGGALPPREQLRKGQVYTLPDGRRATWDGEAFELED